MRGLVVQSSRIRETYAGPDIRISDTTRDDSIIMIMMMMAEPNR
jgi:hypothetical protein